MRIIVFLLKSIVGLLASIGFILVAGTAALIYYGSQVPEVKKLVGEEKIPAETVLELDLAQGLAENGPQDGLLDLARLGKRPLLLSDAVEALERAADDPKVLAVVAHLGRGDLGLAQTSELRDAVLKFRESGKPTIAFAETFGEAGEAMPHFYLATAFEKVWIQPSASLPITGFRFEQPFIGGALEMVGVVPRFDQREEYKGVGSSLTEREQPEAIRENLTDLVDSFLEETAKGIAEARGLSETKVREIIDSAPLNGQQALDLGLVDHLGYWDEVEAEIENATESTESARMGLARYASLSRVPAPESATKIALVRGQGGITLTDSGPSPLGGGSGITSDRMAKALSDAIEDDAIKAIVLRVDSPGGSYVASDTIWHQVTRARAVGKPVIVSMGNLAASGGYFIAMAADKIVAQPMTITGSIGVVSGKFVVEEVLEKLQLSMGGAEAGKNAGFYSATQDFTPEQWKLFQTMLDEVYADFTGKAAAGRGFDAEQIDAVAGGRIWSGADALEVGLVDALGGLSTAIDLAKEAAGVPPGEAIALVPFPEAQDPFAAFIEEAIGKPLSTLSRLEQFAARWLMISDALTGNPQSRLLQDSRFRQ